ASPEVKDAVRYFYRHMDDVLAKALSKVDSSTTLIALSDHGFVPFTREFSLSTWLVQEGFTVLTDPSKLGEGDFFRYVNWSKTRAYVIGLNGIYINLAGREPRGWVSPEEAERTKLEIRKKLAPVTDPQNGKRIITNVYDPREIYSGDFVNVAPDLVVGYQAGYRISDEAVLGKFPRE